MIVWLASYPRSGNTFLRIILHHIFGLRTYSIYNDITSIGAHEATTEIVGHAFLPSEWSLKQAQLDNDLWLIKTHDMPQDDEKAIYVIRDGREVSASYLNYLHSYLQREIDLFEVITGTVNFGSWSDHVVAWNPLERKNTLLLKFEELMTNPQAHIPTIANFLEYEPTSNSMPTFGELHSVNPTFFRSGRKDSWKDIFDRDYHFLFWLLHQNVMIKYGYENEMPDICRKGLSPVKQQNEYLQECREQLKRQNDCLDQLETNKNKLEAELNLLQNSRSWRITAPLRKVTEIICKVKKLREYC